MATGSGVPVIPQPQLDLGPAAWFRPEPEDPVGNQIRVKFGNALRGAYEIVDQPADQLTAGFASVSGAGFKRYDLVYLNLAGVVQIAQGVEVALAAPAFDGAPGYNLGPPLPQGSPVAFVLVDEPGAVTVVKADIAQVSGFVHLSSDLEGHLVDKGLLGAAPTGLNDIVTTLFAAETRITPITGALVANSGGSTTQAGFVTSPPLNYVHLVDQNSDEIDHSTGARMFGRLTEAAGVWTLSYFYIDAAGVAQTMDPSTDTAGPAPTDVRLVGTPRVFSRNDAARPLFDSSVARLSDQIVGDIPSATTTVEGKVLLDFAGAKAGQVRGRANAGATEPPRGVVRVIQGSGITVALVTTGTEHEFTIAATGSSFPGFGGSGAPGPATPDVSLGSYGAAATAARSDHSHPLSTAYTSRDGVRVQYDNFSDVSTFSTGALGFTPRCAFVIAQVSAGGDPTENGDFSAGFGDGTGASDQHVITVNGNQNASYLTGRIVAGSQGGAAHSVQFQMSAFGSANVTVSRTVGTDVMSGGLLVIGDNL